MSATEQDGGILSAVSDERAVDRQAVPALEDDLDPGLQPAQGPSERVLPVGTVTFPSIRYGEPDTPQVPETSPPGIVVADLSGAARAGTVSDRFNNRTRNMDRFLRNTFYLLQGSF